jgi:hypothetical protein
VEATGPDDFVMMSYGRDRQQSPFTYDPQTPSLVFFEISSMSSFNEDLAIWNGYWVHAPKAAQLGN